MAPSTANDAPAVVTQSVRMKRMTQTLKKALDMSVSGASTVNLRAFFEEECKDDHELLEQLFALSTSSHGGSAPTAPSTAASVDQQEHVAGELSAQTLQTLRQEIEKAFQELCERHNLHDQLTTMEATIDEAQRQRIHEQATKELEETKRKEAEEEAATATAEPTGGLVGGARVSPEELIRAERIRVMEVEKKQLESLVRQLQMKKEEQQTRLNIKREMATNAIEDLHQVTRQMHEATAFAKDYAAIRN